MRIRAASFCPRELPNIREVSVARDALYRADVLSQSDRTLTFHGSPLSFPAPLLPDPIANLACAVRILTENSHS
jgi:hypothetical protein